MADKLPELQTQEKLSPTLINDSGVSSALNKFALSTNALGEFGANMAQSAANQRALVQGTEMGQTPEGDLMAPITATDKAFVDAYHSSAHATLSLQGNQAMADAQVAMARKPQIGQSDIDAFAGTMAKTTQNILDHAPTAIKSSLASSLGNSLISSTKQLEIRMISEDRARQKDQAGMYAQSTMTQLYNQAYSQDIEGAKAAADDYVKTLQGYVSAGIMTQKQVQDASDGARLTIATASLGGQAVKAANEGKAAEFLNNLASKDIAGLNPIEQESAKKGALNQVRMIQSMKVQQQNEDASTIAKKVTQGIDTPSDWERFKQNATPEAYNKSVTKALHSKSTNQKAHEGTQVAVSDWTNPSLVNSKPSDINAAFDQTVAKSMKDNPGMSQEDAMVSAASQAGAPVPKLVKLMNSNILRGGASSVNQTAQMISSIHRNNAANLPISNDAAAILYPYIDAVNAKNENQSDQEVLDAVKKEVANQDGETLKALDVSYSAYARTNFGNDSHKLSFTRQLFDHSSDTVVQNDVSSQTKALELFEHNFKLFRGDSELAKKITSQQLGQSYGESHINGVKESGYMMPNNVAKLPQEATPIIQNQINQQVMEQLKVNNEAFDSGNAHAAFKYEIKGREDFESGLNAPAKLAELQGRKPKSLSEKRALLDEIQKTQRAINEFKTDKPTTVIRTDQQGNKEEFTLYTATDSLVAIDGANANRHVGDWHVSLRSKDGQPVEFKGTGPLAVQGVRYRMDLPKLQNQTAAFLGLSLGGGESYKDAVAKFMEARKGKQANDKQGLQGTFLL